nr:MAG TPA: hypothetical protein [Caudoviricetes sp.]
MWYNIIECNKLLYYLFSTDPSLHGGIVCQQKKN